MAIARKFHFMPQFREKTLILQLKYSEAYDRDTQEIQIDLYGGTYRRDAAGTDGGCGKGCQGVKRQS